MKPTTIPAVLAIVLFLLSVTGAVAAAPPRVLFDQGHGQRFVVEKDGPLYLSGLAQTFRDAGLEVSVTGSSLTDGILAANDILVISGPFQPYTPDEVDRIVRFVENGGRLAVMLHIGPPLADLLHRLDVDFTNRPINEQANTIEGEKLNFAVRKLSSHPLTSGLEKISVFGSWALMNTNDDSAVIAASSDASYIDLNGDGTLSDGDAVQSFGVAVAGQRGAGRFVVFGDDAIFQNRFLDDANRTLARNLAHWLR